MVTVMRASSNDVPAIGDIDCAVTGTDERLGIVAGAVTAGHCVVAWWSGQIVGFAVYAPSFFARWFIELVIVDSVYRRRGIATRLIAFCEADCHAEKLFTSTNESNIPMQRVLDTLGYVRSGYIENLDEGDPELIYVKRLRAITD